MTVRETALLALFDRIVLAAAGVAAVDAIVTRNQAADERLEGDEAAWLNLVDGAPDGAPIGVLGGGGWEFSHRARLGLDVGGSDDPARDARFDALIDAINSVLLADPTLGGAVDLAEVQAVEEPDPELLGEAIGLKVGVLPILLIYTAPTAAG